MTTKNQNECKVQNTEALWVPLRTLGGKAKEFFWMLDSSFSIHISREFKNASNKNISIITAQELEKLNDYMRNNDWVDLANNVERLVDGTEKDGIGKFLYEKMGWDVVDAQLASQLSAILSLTGVWEHNGLKRGMKFKMNNEEWEESVEIMYKKLISDAV